MSHVILCKPDEKTPEITQCFVYDPQEDISYEPYMEVLKFAFSDEISVSSNNGSLCGIASSPTCNKTELLESYADKVIGNVFDEVAKLHFDPEKSDANKLLVSLLDNLVLEISLKVKQMGQEEMGTQEEAKLKSNVKKSCCLKAKLMRDLKCMELE